MHKIACRFVVAPGKEEGKAPALIDVAPEKSCSPCAHSLMVAKYESSLVQVFTIPAGSHCIWGWPE